MPTQYDHVWNVIKIDSTLSLGANCNLDVDGTVIDLAELAAINSIAATDLAKIDGITNGTGAAGKALVLDSSGDVAMPANGVLCDNATRNTIANAGTISDAQHRDLVLYQDASGGNVTMTTRTGTQLAAAFPNLPTGGFIPQYVASNHATNTSTIAGGTDVTLVGSGAVTQTGGQFLLIKTAATTFDLVRVG